MNPHSGMDGNDKNDNNNSRRTKAIAAIPMAGILVAAALLSGLVFFTGSSSCYQPAMAQQNTTGTPGAATGAGGTAQSSACTSTQTAGCSGGTTTGGAAGSHVRP